MWIDSSACLICHFQEHYMVRSAELLLVTKTDIISAQSITFVRRSSLYWPTHRQDFISLGYTINFDTGQFYEGWGAKYRSCYEYIDVDLLVCEKEIIQADLTCGRDYFKCNNNTCILYVYKCDHENDCFDGTDEIYCEFTEPVIDNTSRSDMVILSCQLNFNCSLPKAHLIVYIHFVCDGIYSNAILIEENKFGSLKCRGENRCVS